jgi:hypothetical protein
MSMREDERIRELERIIGEVTAANDARYQRGEVLQRYVAALEAHITDRDVGSVAETDLDTWEQRHESRYWRDDWRDDGGEARTHDMQHAVLRLEFGWRVYPMGEAKRADVQSMIRQMTREHIEDVERDQKTLRALMRLSEEEGDADALEELRSTYALTEERLADYQRELLSPLLRADHPYGGGPGSEQGRYEDQDHDDDEEERDAQS